LEGGTGHGAEVGGKGAGTAVLFLAPGASLSVIVIHRRFPAGRLFQPAVQRLGQDVRMRGSMIDAHPAPGVHDLMCIAHQGPSGAIGQALVTGNISGAANF